MPNLHTLGIRSRLTTPTIGLKPLLRPRSSTPRVTIMAPARRKQSNLPPGYREDSTKGAMLRFEDSLPRLPVPTLEETAKRYLKSVHPLLNKQEYENTRRIMTDFIKPGGQGETLQKRLLARRDDPETKNWLHEWWQHAAYLDDRGPVVPYVSYFYSHRDDRQRRDPAKRAAALTTAVLDFQRQVDSASLEPEYMRKLPMAMSSYKWMFNACRIPAQTSDYSVKHSHQDHPYIIVIRKNQFFKLPTSINNQPLNTSELETLFRRVYTIAEPSPPVGALTSWTRNEWASARDTLLSSPANRPTLDAIESSSFIICLDSASPITLEERAHAYWHGDGANRWYDKPLQFIVNENGTSGFMGEHSMMDGTPTHRLNDYANHCIFNNTLDFSSPSIRSDLPDPLPLPFTLSPTLLSSISSAQSFFSTTIASHSLRVQAYQGYGKSLIKKLKCSPDAYVQLIIQLAYFKMHGRSRPTYESAATRKFQQGRTETCRSVTDESTAFCTAMQDPSVPASKCAELFRAALKAHVAYISDASDGRGVDRHLFGLKKLVDAGAGEPLPEVFKDPAYAYSATWYISSSQLSSEYFNGYGWSQVVDAGWGIAYMINEHSIQFNIVSKHLGCKRMSFYINEAAGEIRDVLVPELEAPKAKL